MKVLMFGWEFPPHISGGLGTACFGITHSLVQENTEVLFLVPKLYGDEPLDQVGLINASEIAVPDVTTSTLAVRQIESANERIEEGWTSAKVKELKVIKIPSSLIPYQPVTEQDFEFEIERWNYRFDRILEYESTTEVKEVKEEHAYTYSFSGGYGNQLVKEVYRYAEVASVVAHQHTFDVIHAHDWMTFPAAIAAKKISGKPLVVHVHATEFDRALNGGDPHVVQLEREGMEAADRVVAVSQWTKDILVKSYGISPEKISVVHNGIILSDEFKSGTRKSPVGTHVVTFLGRITHQKGPRYFVDAAQLVLEKFPHVHFLMAGSGDLFPQIIERVAQLKLSSRFHFTGFLKKAEIDKILSFSDVYVMPSVSEPFGITPLEAIHAGVPVIISNQSGVAEVMEHALKVDFWDSKALANAICSILNYASLSSELRNNGGKEIKEITWNKAAKKLNTIYYELVK